jgi:REP element-mobilizing transposase RayT
MLYQVATQLGLTLGNTWGGKRRGAGRKPTHGRAGVPHLPRTVSRHQPLHVTVRVRDGLPSLRSQSLLDVVLAQIRAAKRRFLRIAHFSVQSNHIHLIVEADEQKSLGRGMQGLGVRVARSVNRLLASRGNIFADRYHARTLRTPRDVRNVLVYVLRNRWKHDPGFAGVDRCSSAQFFDGWSSNGQSNGTSCAKARGSPDDWPVVPGQTWLLRRGWERWGKLTRHDAPKARTNPPRSKLSSRP